MRTPDCKKEKEYLKAEVVYRAFQSSGKRHLLLTGSRGAGKTTLFDEMLSRIPVAEYGRLKSTLHPGREVVLRDPLTGKEEVIGAWTVSGGRSAMEAIPSGFLRLGREVLDRVARGNSQWFAIDEVGFLETSVSRYCDQILELMEKKRLLAVVRKQELPFLKALLEREDAFDIDLDEPFGKTGCVIMASGLGRRFGGNKLMADFDGEPLIGKALESTEGVFAKRVVVTRSEEVARFCGERGAEVILHDKPRRSDTVRIGIQSMGEEITHCMFVPGDQPMLRRETVQSLALAARWDTCHIHRLRFGDRTGAPVVFPKGLFEELERLPEGKGGGYLADKYPEHVKYARALCGEELEDVDTREDLERLLNIYQKEEYKK
ncbi:MAG: NTP transferase domain-containing protein [Acetatifactor sp.]